MNVITFTLRYEDLIPTTQSKRAFYYRDQSAQVVDKIERGIRISLKNIKRFWRWYFKVTEPIDKYNEHR